MLSFPQLTKEEEILIKNMLNEFNSIGFDEAIEERTIDIRKKYNLKIPDAIIAASAISKKCTLITRNKADFHSVADLNLFNPYD